MAHTNQNSPTVEENQPNGMHHARLELLLTGFFIPIVALVMWYLGKLRNPLIDWSWGDYLTNLLYSVFFVLAMRQSISAVLKARLFGWKQNQLVFAAGFLTYFLLQSMVLFMIEKISDAGTLGMVYGVGLILTLAYVMLKIFLLQKQVPTTPKPPVLKARHKGKTVYLNLDRVVCLYTENKVNYVFVKHEKMLLSQTLAELEEQLPRQEFFRINRQAIVSRLAIDHFKRNSNNTLALHLKDFSEELTVSRAKTPGFIAWVKEHN